MLRAENKQLKSQLEAERKRVTGLEAKLVSAEAANRSLSTRVAAYSETKAVLEDELDDKELEVNKMKGEKQRLKAKYDAKVAREKGKAVEEVKREFTAREQRLRESGFKTQAKLNTLRNLVNDTDSNDENVEPVWAGGRQTDSDPNLTSLEVGKGNLPSLDDLSVESEALYLTSVFRRDVEAELEQVLPAELAAPLQPEE